MKNKKKWIALALPALALVLELLPWGVRMQFANPEGAAYVSQYSYFSLLPWGYANMGPLLTALLTCVLLVVEAIAMSRHSRALLKAGVVLAIVSAAVSFLPLAFTSYSVIGGLISLCLVGESVCLLRFS